VSLEKLLTDYVTYIHIHTIIYIDYLGQALQTPANNYAYILSLRTTTASVFTM